MSVSVAKRALSYFSPFSCFAFSGRPNRGLDENASRVKRDHCRDPRVVAVANVGQAAGKKVLSWFMGGRFPTAIEGWWCS